jgi:hypothetical protein
MIIRAERISGAIMDLGGWLRNLGLEQYEAAFRDNAIDEKVLPRLTAEDLKELGVNALGHRRILLDAIAALRGDTQASLPEAPQTVDRRRPMRTMPIGRCGPG